MKTDIEQIAFSIKEHISQEIDAGVMHPAFGRTDSCWNGKEQTFWIVLTQKEANDALQNSGKDISVSRDAPLGAILIQNYEGEHSYSIRGKFKDDVHKNTIKIYNRTKYVPTYDENTVASDIEINMPGDKKTHTFRNLLEFIDRLTFLNQQIQKTQEDSTEVESAQKKEENRILREKLEAERENFIMSTQKFIRQNAELRWQPILDPRQDAIKRKKIFDGGTLIINGGPGTGKTTSLIQRIKFLTSNTIEEYIDLNTKQKKILYSQKTGWIFFSPSKLLALFLKNSMSKESLAANDSTVRVWSKHREDIIRLYGWVEGKDRIFKFYKPTDDKMDISLFNNQNHVLYLVQDFEKYFLEYHIKKIHKNKAAGNSYQFPRIVASIANLLREHLKLEKGKKIKEMEQQVERKEITQTEKELKETKINDDAIFNKVLSDLFRDLPEAYKEYRKEQHRQKNKDWNFELLNILKDKPLINNDEQSLLIYIVNKYCLEVYQHFSTYWERLKHPCIAAYGEHCKPVVAIDEATDFSTIDLLAMHSFRHPEFSSVTLSGDLMQRMTINGLSGWENFSNLVTSPLIENLTISYRQSPTLLLLAQRIYEYSTNKKAEYTSYMKKNTAEPKPLMKISNEQDDKIKWISDRIREIDIIYRQSVGNLPSIAVFVPNEEDIPKFANALEEQLEGDIPVLGCPNGMVLGESSDIRVYAIDKIKGLEFEAVFFHNLDELGILPDNLLLKYLYVGLSRATFYLGVTLSKKFGSNLHFIENCFVQNGDWQLNHNKEKELHDQTVSYSAKASYPNIAKVDEKRGNACSDKREYNVADVDNREVLKIDPNSAETHHNRSTTYAIKGSDDTVKSAVDREHHIEPNNATAYFERGNAYFDKRDYNRAIVDYNETLRIDSNFVLAYYKRGYAYFCKKDYEKAVADCNTALSIDPDNASAMTLLDAVRKTRKVRGW